MIACSTSGLLVPLIAGVLGALCGALGNYLGKQLGAPSDSGFMVGLSAGLALVVWALMDVARWLRKSDRVLVDPKTNQQVVLPDRSSLFFYSGVDMRVAADRVWDRVDPVRRRRWCGADRPPRYPVVEVGNNG